MGKYKLLTILALILSVLSFVVSFLRIDIYITNDTYISLVLTLVGICTTIMVGYQIYSAINVKATMEEYRQEIKEEYDAKSEAIMASFVELDTKAIADRILLYQQMARGYSEIDLFLKWETFGFTMKEALILYSKYNEDDRVKLELSLKEYVETSFEDFKNCSHNLNNAVNGKPKYKDAIENTDIDSVCKSILANKEFERDCKNIISTIKDPLGLDFDNLFKTNRNSLEIMLTKSKKNDSKGSNKQLNINDL